MSNWLEPRSGSKPTSRSSKANKLLKTTEDKAMDRMDQESRLEGYADLKATEGRMFRAELRKQEFIGVIRNVSSVIDVARQEASNDPEKLGAIGQIVSSYLGTEEAIYEAAHNPVMSRWLR